MHKIVVIDAIVLGKRGVGEANTLVSLLSDDLGLIRASARSARLAKSKLRYGLEPLTSGRFSLVRGVFEWKLVGAQDLSRVHSADSPLRRRAVGRVARLLTRLIHGEESVPELYATVSQGLQYLAKSSDEEAEHIECVLVLRILSHLGYLPQTAEIRPFLEQDFFSMELAAAAARSRTVLIRAINESLGATGL